MEIEKESVVGTNSSLQNYYAAFESRIGYRFFLGGTRHFGYYEPGIRWPFPIGRALRRMEDRLFHSLGLQSNARVLDAGCGVGHVAIHLASKGLRVVGIDVVRNHIQRARHEIQVHKLEEAVTLHLMDYHHLDGLANESFDGVYTMETLVHAIDPERALGEFFRVMKPGGVLALHEYDHPDFNATEDCPKDLVESMNQINKVASMPSNGLVSQGVLQGMLERQGFNNFKVEDLSENIEPLYRLFFLVGYIPYLLVCLLGLQDWFINTQAAVQGYRILRRGLGAYVVVTAKKPSNKIPSTGE